MQSFAIQHRVSKADPESGNVLSLDILAVTESVRHVWETRRNFPLEETEITVVSENGLIDLKTLRNSGQDQEDIRQLRKESK